jgi:anti-sigma B factor antagonist
MTAITTHGGVDADATMPIPVLRRSVRPARDAPVEPAAHLVIVPGGLVRIAGRLDVHTVADVRLVLHEAIDTGSGDLLVDLAEAEVGDATGLGVLVGAHHRARRAGRRLVLVHVPPRLDRLLRATRLHRVLARG